MKYYSQADKSRNTSVGGRGGGFVPTPPKDITAAPYAHEHMGILCSHICAVPSVLLCVALIPRKGPGQMVSVGKGGGGVPHVVSLHSDKLCSMDMPPTLNKPVAAPMVEPIAQTAVDRRLRRRIK